MGNEGKSKVLDKGTIEVVFTSGKKYYPCKCVICF